VLGLGVAELRTAGHHRQVARDGEARTATHRRAVDRGHDRRHHLRERKVQLHGEGRALLGRLRIGELLELAEIGAGAECGSRARQHHAAHRLVGVRPAQRLEQRARQGGVERVALLRAVQRQHANRALVFDEQDHGFNW